MAPLPLALGLYGGDGQGSAWFVAGLVGALVLVPVIVGLLWRLRDRRDREAG